MGKTTLQKCYSFLGFWHYHEMTFHKEQRRNYLVIYWCFWPWRFKRKIDVIRIDRTAAYNRNLERQYKLIRDSLKETHNEQY